jgi:hypothetical protein
MMLEEKTSRNRKQRNGYILIPSIVVSVGVRERSSLASNNNVTCTIARGNAASKQTNKQNAKGGIEPNIRNREEPNQTFRWSETGRETSDTFLKLLGKDPAR